MVNAGEGVLSVVREWPPARIESEFSALNTLELSTGTERTAPAPVNENSLRPLTLALRWLLTLTDSQKQMELVQSYLALFLKVLFLFFSLITCSFFYA